MHTWDEKDISTVHDTTIMNYHIAGIFAMVNFRQFRQSCRVAKI